jgi:hypothetical protein
MKTLNLKIGDCVDVWLNLNTKDDRCNANKIFKLPYFQAYLIKYADDKYSFALTENYKKEDVFKDKKEIFSFYTLFDLERNKHYIKIKRNYIEILDHIYIDKRYKELYRAIFYRS